LIYDLEPPIADIYFMNEWEFTGDIASWINELLITQSGLPFSRAKVEQTSKGSQKRRDLTLLDKGKNKILTGEIRFPWRKDGGSPYSYGLVNDARKKAQRAKSPFFFTWNINQFVLWETTPSKTSWKDQNYKSWVVTQIHRQDHLELPMTAHAVQNWLEIFLQQYAQILRGTAPIGIKPPDEKFIDALESELHLPIALNIEQLCSLYKQASFRSKLDKWMREEQGWTIYTDNQGIQDNLERAAKFSCYALVNKLVFHEALLKRYHAHMDKLEVPEHIETGEALRGHLEGYFASAKEVTGDYETVFGEDHTSMGNRIPFYADSAVSHWRTLINQIHRFDFSKLDYEIIGGIFERLISPEERSKFGQFYTRVEIVDLINSFCIRTGKEKILDPACGGGTFLVRAYARKRELDPGRKHGELLKDLFGIDISHFATHLTTINLATRNLIDDENYPQIGRSDFFDIEPHRRFIQLPTHIQAKGLGKDQHREVKIPPLEAVVGNPPYIRQEEIPKFKGKDKKSPSHGTKEFYLDLVKIESGAKLSGRSDIHCYFWPHASSFLKDDGYLCLLTSSQWLDVEYGFRLQEWILNNFEIVTVMESIDEPWFVGARVSTAVTILQRQKDETKRMNNTVRFIQLRRPISELLPHEDVTTAAAVDTADAFRDELLTLKANTTNERYRARLVRQGDLWDEGVRLGIMMGKSEDVGTDNPEHQDGQYYGGKWGVHVRAPDLWFDLLDNFGDRLTPLGNITDVRFGVKTGKDCFFFPKDCSEDCLRKQENPMVFEVEYGVPRSKVESGKVKLVRCGEGRSEIRPLEAKYLEPEVHSLMEVHTYAVTSHACSNSILLVNERQSKLLDPYVSEYINWGESMGYHKNATCASRATQNQDWYNLTQHKRPVIIVPKIQQYRLVAFLNTERLYQNSSLLGIYDVPSEMTDALCAVLNSTIAILSRLVHARVLGNEANVQLDVYSAKMMPVPDLTKASPHMLRRISKLFSHFKKRESLQFVSERRLREMSYSLKGQKAGLDALSDQCELDMPDRRELDDAVLEMLGVKTKKHRDQLIDELYAYLREFFELTRQKEEKAIINKQKSKRRGPARPSDIAAQILDVIREEQPDLLRQYEHDFLDKSKPFDTFEIPPGCSVLQFDMLSAYAVEFLKGRKRQVLIEAQSRVQRDLLALLGESGVSGWVRVPHEDTECHRVLAEYERFVRDRERQLIILVQERTSDEEMQKKIYEALMSLVVQVDKSKKESEY
jgi:hypothetical protein